MNRAQRRALARRGIDPQVYEALTKQPEPDPMYSHPSDPRIIFSESARQRRLAVRLVAAAVAVAGALSGALYYLS